MIGLLTSGRVSTYLLDQLGLLIFRYEIRYIEGIFGQ